MAAKDGELLTVGEVSRLMRLTPRQVRNLITKVKVLPAMRLGRDYLVRRGDVAKVPDRKPGPVPQKRKAKSK